jgi:hypothetical protein
MALGLTHDHTQGGPRPQPLRHYPQRLIIDALIPLDLPGVKHRPAEASKPLLNNLLVRGVGEMIVAFVGIKPIDLLVILLPVRGATTSAAIYRVLGVSGRYCTG